MQNLGVRYHTQFAYVGGAVAPEVLIEIEGERIIRVEVGAKPEMDAERLQGLTLPGFANVHSHAFHRALRGSTQSQGDFWSWRDRMYELSESLDPDSYFELARDTYREMAAAGIAAVGEFHYLHAGGNAMAERLIAAAREVGLRITLLDACYLQGGIDGRPLEGPQLRFGDSSVNAWMERASQLERGDGVIIGAAIHSVRAVPLDAMRNVAAWAAERNAPLHVHVSEQIAENEECLRVHGCTPVELLARAGVLGRNTTAIHATNVTDTDVELLGGSGTGVCLCPTTERDLGDGVGPAARLREAGSHLGLGTDSHAIIDMFEEMRAVELDERLVQHRRGIHSPESLLDAATINGMRQLGWTDAGAISAGNYADLVTIGLDNHRMRGADEKNILPHAIFAATGADITSVIVSGKALEL